LTIHAREPWLTTVLAAPPVRVEGCGVARAGQAAPTCVESTPSLGSSRYGGFDLTPVMSQR